MSVSKLEPRWPDFVGGSLQWAGFVSCLLQIGIDFSPENALVSILAFITSTLTFQYIFRSKAYRDYPLSSLSLLGLCVTTQYGSLLSQTIGWTPLIANLRNARYTFCVLSAYQITALLSHQTYRSIASTLSIRQFLATRVFQPLGVFEIPSPGNCWTIGIIGFLATIVAHPSSDSELASRAIWGLGFLTWLPFILPALYQRYGDDYCSIRKQAIGLGVYVICICVTALAFNWRFLLFAGLVTTVLLYLVIYLQDQRLLRVSHIRNLAFIGVVGYFSTGLAANVVTAMEIAREHRERSTPIEMIEETLAAMQDFDKLKAFEDRKIRQSSFERYDETYVANPLFSRFVETKFDDNMFYFIEHLSNREERMATEEISERLWAILPEPVLKLIDPSRSKDVLTYSMGDFWAVLRTGGSLGGFKTGSMFADGVAIFGEVGFAVVYFFICILIFALWDSLSLPRKDNPPEISALAMLLTWRLFQYSISGESIASVITFPVRGFLQSIGLYLIAYWLSRAAFGCYRPNDPGKRVISN